MSNLLLLITTKTETIPEINNTKQAKTKRLISRTCYYEHQVDSTSRRHFVSQISL